MNYLLSFVTLAAIAYALRTRRSRNHWRTKYWLSLNDVERAEKERDVARVNLELANAHVDLMCRLYEEKNEAKCTEVN